MVRACRIPACVVLVLAVALVAGCKRAPYGCVPVSGKVAYEDGSLIPAEQIRLTFVPQTPPAGGGVAPREGSARVDAKTGTFPSATTYALGDGIIAGKHKVLVNAESGGRSRPDLVPKEYSDPDATPLTVDTAQLPLDIKVKKPHK